MDYDKLGFKCGLEAHQQLETHKLFCKCPSIVHDNKIDILFKRKLRAIAGELGEVDRAALAEIKKNKIYSYEACSTSSCLVEYDDEPPHEVNMHAVKISLEVAMLLKMKIVDEIEFMRKTVVDGSNVCGFQRTALIGYDGYIETSKGRVNIPTLCLEEEAAQKIKENQEEVVFRLDRLGVPLIEIATSPDIKDNEHAKETAALIGMILRSTGKVKRGIGSIRQDVNVSIKGHKRVEIKGFQELRMMPKVIENEIIRQEKNKEEDAHVRRFNPDATTEYLRPMPGAERMYPETDIKPVRICKEMLMEIKLPELLDDMALRYTKEYEIREDTARELVRSDIDFTKFLDLKLEKAYIADVLVNYPKEIKRRFELDASQLEEKDFIEVLKYLEEGKIAKEAVIDLLVKKIKGESIGKFKSIDDDELEKELKKVVQENKGASLNALMGEAMKKFRGKVDGKKIMDFLKKVY